MRRRFIRIALISGLLAAFLPSLSLQPAQASGVVGNGTPSSCTETAFNNALAGGGLVTFNCGAALHTINLTGSKVISQDTQIDGGNRLVLDMNDSDRHFSVSPLVTLRLQDIRLEDGDGGIDGGLISNRGTVIADHVVFADGYAPDHGGAIHNDGTLIVTDGHFTNNLAEGNLGGGAIYNTVTGTVSIMGNSSFTDNLADSGNGGAIVNNGGTVDISGTTEFVTNHGEDGGAIANVSGGNVTITMGHFESNTADNDGGAIYNADGAVTIASATLFNNAAGNRGGAVANLGPPVNTVEIERAELISNDADQGGAVHNAGTMTIVQTDLVVNRALSGSGGAINNAFNGSLTVTRSTLWGNTASERGGGIRNDASATIETSTISTNSSSNQGGGIVNQDQLAIYNSTITLNESGGPGGGIRNAGEGTLNISNTIVADNPSGNDCSNDGGFNSLDFNLDSDTSCSLGMTNDISGGNANLESLTDNGVINFHPLGPGSDAIDAGPATCTSPDQRGEMRPRNGACDIGAVEVVPPPDVCYNLYTGQLQRTVGGQCQPPYLVPVIFEEGPHYLCANLYTGILSYSYAATCQPYNMPAIVMPDEAPLAVCLNFYTGKFRKPVGMQPCSAGEYATVLQ